MLLRGAGRTATVALVYVTANSSMLFAQGVAPDVPQLNVVSYTALLHDPQQNPPDPNAQPKPAPQPPERKPKFDIYIGPSLGVYMPTSSKTRGRFGSDWLSYGVGVGSVTTPHNNGRFSPDFQIVSQQKGDDNTFFVLLGVEYRRSLFPWHERSQPDQQQPGAPAPPNEKHTVKKPNYIPYVGVSIYEAVGDLTAVEDGVHSGVRSGVAGSAFLGLEYRNVAYIEARYIQTSVLKGFDLSGFNLSIGYRFRIIGY